MLDVQHETSEWGTPRRLTTSRHVFGFQLEYLVVFQPAFWKWTVNSSSIIVNALAYGGVQSSVSQ